MTYLYIYVYLLEAAERKYS